MISTRRFFALFFEVFLDEAGYDVTVENGYFIATSSDPVKEDYLIFPVARVLTSNKTSTESTMVRADGEAIAKLIKLATEKAGNLKPAIAFGVGKYSYLDCEIFMVELNAFENAENDESPALFIKNKKYYFDFSRLKKDDNKAFLRVKTESILL